jgi:hypothetical protein
MECADILQQRRLSRTCSLDLEPDGQPMITIPRKPSTVTVPPVRIASVAAGTPVTHGIPSSWAMSLHE